MNKAGQVGVLHVDTERAWGGGQQQVAWLLEGVAANGWPTALVCPPGSVLEERCRVRGLDVQALPMRGEFDLAAGRRIARIARERGLSVVHAHSGHALALGLWARLFDRRLRLVATRRVAFAVRGGLFGRLKHANPLLDRVVCISEKVRQGLVDSGVAPGRLLVIASGVDTRRFAGVRPPPQFRRSLGVPNGHLVVGTVASLVDAKDYPTLLRAARAVLDATPDVTFVAVGDGPLARPLAALAAELGLGRRFLFQGFREDVGVFMKSFDVFVLASKAEGLGTSVLDAQALGLPLVACRAGGIPEIVADRETGLLVPPGDAPALSAALVELIRNPGLRAALGAAARKAAAAHDVSRTVAAHLDLYRSLM